MIEFSPLKLLIVILVTLLCLISFFAKKRTLKFKLFISIIFTFLFIYNGIGGALIEVNNTYIWYYSIYIVVFTLSIHFFISLKRKNRSNFIQSSLHNFITNYSSFIISLYLLISLLDLIYPEFKIQTLLRPPMPDVNLHLDDDYDSRGGGILYYLGIMLSPLYYIVIAQKRNRPTILALLLITPMYITYCATSYISRNQILQIFLLLGIIFFIDGSVKRRKNIVICSLIGAPFLIYFFYQYSIIRLGADTLGISLGKAIEIIAFQEIKFPTYFNEFWGNFSFSASSYFEWLLLLPLPGFLKFGFGQMPINEEFTLFITHLSRGDSGFSIVLPGLVNESLIIFKYLFFIHAIIYAYFVSLIIKLCSVDENMDVLFFYMCFLLSFSTARAGTTASYPSIIKYVIVLAIFLYFNKNKSIKKCSQIQS